MKILNLFLPLFLTIFSWLPWRALAQEVPASWEFVILKTAHFDVIVNARQQDLGQLYAQKLETAYSFLNPLFTDKPDRTVVIINDTTDVTNGYATRIPYSHIMAYPVLPGPSESLAESGDWALELLTHEYTHILNFQPANGVMKYLRYVFGTVISPNMLLPQWWKEGLAVHIESQVSRGGRLRSLYQDAVVRSFVQDKILGDFDLAQVNEVLPSWPEGHRSYLFGSLIWSQMVAHKGDAVVDTLNQRHGGRVPYFIETPAKDHLGQTYVAEYRDTLKEIQTRAQKQITSLETLPPTPLTFLDLNAKYVNHPAVSPDGHYLAVISVNDSDKREVKLLERKNNEPFNSGDSSKKVDGLDEDLKPPVVKDGPPTGSIQRVSWFHHSPKIVFDKMDNINRLERYSDLSIYDVKTQKSDAFTRHLRGREPAVSPSDQDVVFVLLSGGKTSLAVYNLAAKKAVIVWSPPLQARISYPGFVDEDQIIFALREPLGEEGLWIFERKSRKVRRILSDFKTARFPLVTTQGLFFTSSQNGVHNLYRAEKDFKSATPVSHVVSAVLDASWDPVTEDLYVTTLSSKGPQVARLAAADWKKLKGPLPTISGLLADRYPLTPAALALEKTPPQNVVENKEDYHSGSYLWPHYWMPYIATSTIDNSLVVQASTSGFDPLKKHIYSITGSYETGVKRGSVLGTYQNNQTGWPILLTSSQVTSYLYSSDYLLTNSSTSLSVWPEVWRFSRYSLVEIGAKQLRSEFLTRTPTRKGIFARWIYSDYTRAPSQISPEGGQSGYLGATNYFSNTDDINHTQYIFGASYYHSRWLPRHHAILLKVNGYYVAEDLYPIFGAATSAYMPLQDFTAPVYVLRGSRTGQFVGRRLYNFNAEYRLPLRDIYHGTGTDPYFLRRLHAAIVADGVSLDGFAFNTNSQLFQRVGVERSYYSVGAEARLETTLGYILPLNVILGAYSLQNPDTGASTAVGLNLQLGSVL